MKSLKFLVPLIATAAMVSAAVPAKASIVFDIGASGTGNNVLFHNITGNGTSHLTSDTNQGDNVTFTSTTDTLSSPSKGQARLVAGDGSLGEVMWYLTDLTKGFTKGVFNIDTPRGGANSVTIYAVDQHGEFSETFSLKGNGQNFFTITSNGGDIIESLRIVMTGGKVDDVKQFRIDGIQSIAAAVPEPSTWAMMLIGFAGLGFAGYRRKSKPALMAA